MTIIWDNWPFYETKYIYVGSRLSKGFILNGEKEYVLSCDL